MVYTLIQSLRASSALYLSFGLELAVMLLLLQPLLLTLWGLVGLLWRKHKILPRLTLAPPERRLHHRARHERTLKQLEPELQDLSLLGRIVRLATGVAERKIRMHQARKTDMP